LNLGENAILSDQEIVFHQSAETGVSRPTDTGASASNPMVRNLRQTSHERKVNMPDKDAKQKKDGAVQELIDALNEDLAREYQAIIAYTVYSNVLSGAQWMQIAAELKLHAAQELQHALIIADQIDYLGGMPTATPKEVKLSKKAEEMLRFDLDNETETIRNYRQRVKQAEVLGHFALAEQLRTIISQEQEHQHDLATALGIDVPHVLLEGA
jgi:bacterioferritin